jgi:collagenase-like PrtC family protease
MRNLLHQIPERRSMLSQENQQVFVLNGIQTMSGYVYNLGNELTSMHGLVDMVRLSPLGNETFAMLDAFRANENGCAAAADGQQRLQRLLETSGRAGIAGLKPLTLLTTVSDFNALLKMQLFWPVRPAGTRPSI